MAKESEKRYQLKMLQVENKRNKYELERKRQEKKIMEKNLDSIFDPFEREYLKMKKMGIQVVLLMIILVIVMNMMMEIMEVIYHLISFYIVSLSFG